MGVDSEKTEMQRNTIQRNTKIFKVPFHFILPILLILIILLIFPAKTLAEPVVEKSHIVIIPEKKTFVIEVLSFSGDGTTELMLDMPENARLINISGSLNYSSTKIEGNTILFENASVINGSHVALEYSLSDRTFRKKITLETHKLLVFIPAMVDVIDKSDNLVFKGTAPLGRSNYSILEAKNLLPGEEIYLKFEERKFTTPSGEKSEKSESAIEIGPNFNLTFLIGITLVIGGAMLLIFTKRTKTWDVRDVKRDVKGEKEEEKEEKKEGWEI